MTSFGWKRKLGGNISKTAQNAFQISNKEDEDEAITSGEVDWLTLVPKRRNIQLEDAISKSERLKQEGNVLAEADRYWEALKKWEEATHFTPENASLYELKSQAYMAVNEVYPAITAATKAVELNSLWWNAYQTLGRAHLNLGEVRIAIKCFSKAIHLNPAVEELWKDDLLWAVDLLKRKKNIDTELQASSSTVNITELDEKDSEKGKAQTFVKGKKGSLDIKLLHMDSCSNSEKEATGEIKRLPVNYVVMRD